MARYTGPKSRIARKFGEGIFGADKVLSKKNYPPGQHGNSRKRKTSEYGVQLREKQKAKYTYGVLEKQFRNLFEKAATAKGITGEVLLQLLEGRLDNVVFRLGIAPTRAAARQLVSHKHITVDGEVVNIPSYAVKPGQVIGVRERSKSLEVIANSLAGFNHSKYPWMEWDDNAKVGKLLHVPERADQQDAGKRRGRRGDCRRRGRGRRSGGSQRRIRGRPSGISNNIFRKRNSIALFKKCSRKS